MGGISRFVMCDLCTITYCNSARGTGVSAREEGRGARERKGGGGAVGPHCTLWSIRYLFLYVVNFIFLTRHFVSVLDQTMMFKSDF